MAGTKFSEIFDLFMVKIKDWRLQALFESSVHDFENYLSGFLVLAVPSFAPICVQALTYNEETKEFNVELSVENKVILSQLMVENWLAKEVQDVNQMNLHLMDRDFKIYSEAQNLKEKSLHLDKVKEYNSLAITSYSYLHSINWQNWLSGNFFPV
jgi:ribosome-associated toxin RatA of RatAB toxin-antitoxin module